MDILFQIYIASCILMIEVKWVMAGVFDIEITENDRKPIEAESDDELQIDEVGEKSHF